MEITKDVVCKDGVCELMKLVGSKISVDRNIYSTYDDKDKLRRDMVEIYRSSQV